MALAKTKTGRTKLLHRKHTGSLQPHHHTSYGSLLLILLVAFLPLVSVSHRAYAVDQSGQQQSYSVGAVVPSAPPGATTIGSPANGAVLTSTAAQTITGSCQSTSQVQIFVNQVMAGSTTCKSGNYSLSVNLFIGQDQLFSQAFNADGIGGPKSSPINVTLLPPGAILQGTTQYNTTGAPANQFYIAAERFVQSGPTATSISWTLFINGGSPPYSVLVGWGDGVTTTYTPTASGQFTISHSYSQPAGSRGSFPITIKATDGGGDQSYLQLIAAVNNSKLSGLSSLLGNGYGSSVILRLAWQLLGLAVVAVIFFWIGEKREKRVLRAR